MRDIGVTRPIDELGRVVIPKEFRSMLGIKPRDLLEISLTGNIMCLKKHTDCCILCGETGNHVEVDGNIICLDCVKKIRNI